MRALFPFFVVMVATLALACGDSPRAPEETPAEHGIWVNMGDPPSPPPPRVDEVAFHAEVRFDGRFDRRDVAGPRCAWPACRAVAKFEGNTARVWLNEEAAPWMDGGPSEWDVVVDGVWKWKLVAQLGVHDYVLASGLKWGVHEVELYRRSEARYGTTQILGFDFHAGILLPAAAPRARRIEVIGDAMSAGVGIEGVGRGEGCPGGIDEAAWQNIRAAYPQRLADLLGAELDAAVASGVGVAKNWWRPDPATIGVLQERALPFDPASAMVNDTRALDAIVVMTGESDFAIGAPEDDGPSSESDFRRAYGDLVDRLRTRAPAAEIFLVTSPTASDVSPPGRLARTTIGKVTTAITEVRRNDGDLWIHAITLDPAQPSELTACGAHGNADLHDRVARELAAKMRALSTTRKWVRE